MSKYIKRQCQNKTVIALIISGAEQSLLQRSITITPTGSIRCWQAELQRRPLQPQASLFRPVELINHCRPPCVWRCCRRQERCIGEAVVPLTMNIKSSPSFGSTESIRASLHSDVAAPLTNGNKRQRDQNTIIFFSKSTCSVNSNLPYNSKHLHHA